MNGTKNHMHAKTDNNGPKPWVCSIVEVRTYCKPNLAVLTRMNACPLPPISRPAGSNSQYMCIHRPKYGCARVIAKSQMGSRDCVAKVREYFVWWPLDHKCKAGNNMQYLSWFCIGWTLWLLGMKFSSAHTKLKNSYSHPLPGYEVQTNRIWTANDLGSKTGSPHGSHIGQCLDPKPTYHM